ncbi:hypothetical protein [Leeia sp.]|uniref:hypothetical protein n=1 Tax=Leeia sp. TaxID=2884678 RepID=UPI0035ADEDB1
MPHARFGRQIPPHQRLPVAWYNPGVLWRTVRELLSSDEQLRTYDRREVHQGPIKVADLRERAGPDGLHWDFVSDLGDGGSATYAVAEAVQRPELSLADGTTLPNGRVLVFGGDLAYPGASPEEYQFRFTEMWEAARPAVIVERTVLAIPQNHDWFDNASTFYRYFVDHQSSPLHASETPQERGYFVARLSAQWWLIGLDFALKGDIDRKQFQAIQAALDDLPDSAQLILLYPEPYWTRPLGDHAAEGYPKRYQRLEAWLEHEKRAAIRIRLAGDSHHYYRRSNGEGDQADHLITCGSGGAFLHPTHGSVEESPLCRDASDDDQAMTPDLRARVRLGTLASAQPDSLDTFTAKRSYPDLATSRKLAWGNLLTFLCPPVSAGAAGWRSLLQGNPAFLLLLAALTGMASLFNHLVLPAQALVTGWGIIGAWLPTLWQSPLAGVWQLTPLVLAMILTDELHGWRRGLGIVSLGIGLWLLQPLLYLQWLELHTGWQLSVALSTVLWLVTAMLLGGLGCGLWLAVMSRYLGLRNNGFSPMAIADYKGFLRCRIDTDEQLHLYFIGCDRVPTEWLDADGSRAQPLWQPKAAAVWQVRDQLTVAPHPPSLPAGAHH